MNDEECAGAARRLRWWTQTEAGPNPRRGRNGIVRFVRKEVEQFEASRPV